MSKNVTKKLPKQEKTQYLLGFLYMERVRRIDENRLKP